MLKGKQRDYNRALGTLFAAEHPYSLLTRRGPEGRNEIQLVRLIKLRI